MAKKQTRKATNATIKRKKYTDKGRPTLYTTELINEICDLIATTPFSLVKILILNPHLPSYRTIMSWLDNPKYTDFLHKYDKSRMDKADYMADNMIDIAIEAKEDVITRKVPAAKASAFMAGARLEIDVMKFHAMKMKPKKYGDSSKVDLTSNGKQIKMNVAWLGKKTPPKDE